MAVSVKRYIKIRRKQGATDKQIRKEILQQMSRTLLTAKVDTKNMTIILGG